jgi:hypothetical protein
MEKKTYSEKLKVPRWQKKRLEIFNRDKWTCRQCGEKENTLYVHHLKYSCGKEPWDIDNDLLITLCESCHEIETLYRKDVENDLLELLKELNLLLIDVESFTNVIRSLSKSHGVKNVLNLLLWFDCNKSGEDNFKRLINEFLNG